MIKLQDFATQTGVTDRQIQRLIKKYSEELEGTYERKGPNGTWLSEQACEILRSKMKVKEIAVADDGTLQKLQQKIVELEERIERKDVIIERLQERETEKDRQLQLLQQEQLLLEQKAQERLDEAVRAAEDKLQLEHLENMSKLREEYKEKIEQLQEDLRKEQNKPFWQRIFKKNNLKF